MSLEDSRKAVDLAIREGEPWTKLTPLIWAWWKDLKAWEGKDTFNVAFKDQRMSVRQVNKGSTARGGGFDVIHKDDPSQSRPMVLARDAAGIQARLNPDNFVDPKTLKSSKNELGLHDLSASLLDGRRPISEQLKHYQDAYTLFMPLPLEEDLILFDVLNKMAKRETDANVKLIREIRSQLTRVKLAQASDMGTKYVDISDPKDKEGSFRYGVTGTVIRTKGAIGTKATDEELFNRKTNALRYKSILNNTVVSVNEIVVAYRVHAKKEFPMFTVWDDVKKNYRVILVGDKVVSTDQVVTDSGDLQHG